MKDFTYLILLIFAGFSLYGQSGNGSPKLPVGPSTSERATPFELDQVSLLDSPLKKHRNWTGNGC